MRFRSSNPVYKYGDYSVGNEYSATYSGVSSKIAILLGITALVAIYTGGTLSVTSSNMSTFIVGAIVAPIIAFISVIVVHRAPHLAMPFSIVYALCEGMFLGLVSAIYAAYFGNDIIYTALLATFGVFGTMLFLYSTGIIRVGAFFRRFMLSMLFGLIFASILFFIMAMINGVSSSEYSLYILIVVISVVVSSLYLLIDFDNISKYVDAGASKEYEWSLALGLVVTVVWLYIELLRLVAILSSRD